MVLNLGVLVPILALAIPVAGIVFSGLVRLQKLKLEEARIRAGAMGNGDNAEVDALREEVYQVRSELIEMRERVEFTERLLAQHPNRERLPNERANG